MNLSFLNSLKFGILATSCLVLFMCKFCTEQQFNYPKMKLGKPVYLGFQVLSVLGD